MPTQRHDDSVPALANRPVWDLEADPRLLDPGPGDLGGRYDVLVVGGGVIGLATAALCRRAGLGRIAMVERGRLAGGPSGRAGGILAPAMHHGTDPDCLVGFGRSSLSLWRELDREWDGALGLERVDVLQTLPGAEGPPGPGADGSTGRAAQGPLRSEAEGPPGPGAEGPHRRGAAVPALPPGAEVLEPEAARELEPRLAMGSGGVLISDQARVHPLRLAAALARLAGTVATGVRVTGIETAGSRGARVRTDRGDLQAGAVVLATGSAPRIQGVPPAGGQRLVKGTLIATVPAPFRLRVTIGGRGGLAGQLPDGRLLFGNTYDTADSSPEVHPETVAATRADLAALVADAAGLPLSHAWCCFRPRNASGLPVIDKVGDLDNVWTTYGHFRTGFLLAAATGGALASWISDGERPEEITPFSASAA